MSAELSDDELSAVAVFPLPNLVLFPGTPLALHIFEPRYRDMLRDCLQEGRMLLAIAQLEPGWQSAYDGRPPLYQVAGVGRIVAQRKQPDGTYDIELEGVARVRLHELAAERSYRRARASVLIETAPDAGLPAVARASLWSLATGIAALARRDPRFEGMELLAAADDDDSLLLDRLAHQFVSDPAARQRLLETLDVSARLQALERHMAELQLALAGEQDPGPRTLH
jgi:Lon protease-like protein